MTVIEMIKNLALRSSVVASADVLAVFRELEAKDKRIAELEAYNARLREWNAGLAQESCELQAKLATPVRLPDIEFVKISGIDFPVMRADIVKKEVRRAGFKVEGDA